MKSLNIVFAGTPAFTLPCLQALFNSRHTLKAIYTQPDRPAGRGRHLQASAAKEWAVAHQLPVFQPLNFKSSEALNELANLAPDVLVVIAYGLILPAAVLNLPRLGCINVHASLLPRWRGASPIQHALLHGDAQTGVTIMRMDIGMDTGDILTEKAIKIAREETAGQLHDRLAELAVSPLLHTLDALAQGEVKAKAQENSMATYAPKINKIDAIINWQQPATVIHQQIRAFNPWPIAYTHVGETVLRIHQAQVIENNCVQPAGTILSLDKQGMLVATGAGALLVQQIQFPNAKTMAITEWLNAKRDQLQTGLILQ